jgi:hypothetical protein
MKEHIITVDLYASWGDVPPCYRVYMDNDLLTERDFIWNGTEKFIRENIIVKLGPGAHALRIEQINNSGTLRAENVVHNGNASSLDFIVTE